MKPLALAPKDTLARVRFVLTDMDDTLTHRGRLPAETYLAMERLRMAGIRVVPVTAAPAGWCDQMARMWPVDCVVGENGGLFFLPAGEGRPPERRYWHDHSRVLQIRKELAEIAELAAARMPGITVADDQVFRLTSLALDAPASREGREAAADLLKGFGLSTTLNSLWVLGWSGGYDKLSMSRRMMAECFGVDLDRDADQVLYVGDSANDAPMFRHLPNTVGVSTVVDCLPEMDAAPAWVSQGPGGSGFVEVADSLLAANVGKDPLTSR